MKTVAVLKSFPVVKLEHILGYTNNVVKIYSPEGIFYFKESKEHLSLDETLDRAAKEFFDGVEPKSSIKDKVLSALQYNHIREKLFSLGIKDEEGSLFNKYLESNDPSVLGFKDIDEERRIFRRFVFFVAAEIRAERMNIYAKNKELETFGVVRALSEDHIARLLGFDYALPKVEFVQMKLACKTRYGVLSSEVPGESVCKLTPRERLAKTSPLILKDLSSLAIFDAICGDKDHTPNNYHVLKSEEGLFVGIRSYDNDSPSSFSASSHFHKLPLDVAPLINEDGTLNLVGVDEGFASCLKAIKDEDFEPLKNLLNDDEINALKKRLAKVKDALEKSKKANPNFLKKEADWTIDDLREELMGNHGKSYIKSFVDDCYYPEGKHPYDKC
ncbi:MAG: hypothetical protein K6B51_05005 [Bacilli bacterium]|nr:hypothetical protein [Bacilli bacterium]